MKGFQKNSRLHFFLLVLLLACNLHVFAQQQDDAKLARQLFESGEYQKSADLFLTAYNKLHDEESMQFYVRCLIALKKEKDAEKFLKKILKKKSSGISPLVALSSLYYKTERPQLAASLINEKVSDFPQDQTLFVELANALQSAGMTDEGIHVLKTGQEKMGLFYPFYFELAEMYNAKGDLTSMVDQYLESINYNEAYLVQVQNALQTNLDDENSPQRRVLLKQQLLKKIQQYPQKTVFSDMLVWLFTQEKNFLAAFEQLRSLDKRGVSQSPRLWDLSQIAASNSDFSAASSILEYEISKGSSNPYYEQARRGYIDNMYSRLEQLPIQTTSELKSVNKAFEEGIKEMKVHPGTAELVRKYAHFKAFYMDDPDTALVLINQLTDMPAISDALRAKCKLEKADITLFTGDIWEASLLFSQVEKAFKNDVLGQEAKFRNARLSYYKGDFEWAQAQLLVLKAATSKLIANDALDLSMIITDNLGQDSIREPLEMFARADLLLYQNKDSLALLTLDSLTKAYPYHSLADEVLFRKYTMAARKQDFTHALEYLSKIAADFPDDIYADDACYYSGEIYFLNLHDNSLAMKWYRELIDKYPGSIYSSDARFKFRKLRGDNLN